MPVVFYVLLKLFFCPWRICECVNTPLCLCPEVSHRQGLLHCQGTVDHRADLHQRPAGHHGGAETFSQVFARQVESHVSPRGLPQLSERDLSKFSCLFQYFGLWCAFSLAHTTEDWDSTLEALWAFSLCRADEKYSFQVGAFKPLVFTLLFLTNACFLLFPSFLCEQPCTLFAL